MSLRDNLRQQTQNLNTRRDARPQPVPAQRDGTGVTVNGSRIRAQNVSNEALGTGDAVVFSGDGGVVQQERRKVAIQVAPIGRPASPAPEDCLLPGILVFKQTIYTSSPTTTTYVRVNGRDYTLVTTTTSAYKNEIFWHPNIGVKVLLFSEDVPQKIFSFYPGTSAAGIPGLPPPFISPPYYPYRFNQVQFWAENKAFGEVCITLTKNELTYEFSTYKLTETSAVQIAHTIKTYLPSENRSDFYVGNSTIQALIPAPSPLRNDILKSSPYTELRDNRANPSENYSEIFSDLGYPLEIVDINNIATKTFNTTFSTGYNSNPPISTLHLPVLFNNSLLSFNLLFDDPFTPINSSPGFKALLLNNKISAAVEMEVFTKKATSYQKDLVPNVFPATSKLNLSSLGTLTPSYSTSAHPDYFYIPSKVDISDVASDDGFENRIVILGSYFYPATDCKIKNDNLLTTQKLGKFYVDSGEAS
jgi:hypothetical protein